MSIYRTIGPLDVVYGHFCVFTLPVFLKKSWEAYWFLLVRASVRTHVRPFVQAMVFKLTIWILLFNNNPFSNLSPLMEYCPLSRPFFKCDISIW